MLLQDYYMPERLEDALDIIAHHNGRAKVMAGGTDLFLQLQQHEISTEAIVDISNIKELRYIKKESDIIKIGALTTHTELVRNSILKEEVSFLSEAAESIGSEQIRNVGTVGGNVVSAQPAADTALPLMALNAKATILSQRGEKEVPLSELYKPQGGTAIDPSSEIIACFSFSIPAKNRGAGAFRRLAKRKALALPILNTAVVLWVDDKNIITDARIVIGPVAPIPFRAKEAENVLIGFSLEKNVFEIAAKTVANEACPRESFLRGCAPFRQDLSQVLVLQALIEASETLQKKGVA